MFHKREDLLNRYSQASDKNREVDFILDQLEEEVGRIQTARVILGNGCSELDDLLEKRRALYEEFLSYSKKSLQN